MRDKDRDSFLFLSLIFSKRGEMNTLFNIFERKDNSKYDHKPDCQIPIYGMYHIFCTDGWNELVRLQIEHLKESRLLEHTTMLYISCITKNPETDVKTITDICGTEKIKFVSISSDAQRYEFPALQFIKEKSAEENCLFYYFHTKGVSYHAKKNGDKEFTRYKRYMEAWREMMEYFIFDKWQVAVNALLDGYDAYGCFRMPPPPQRFRMFAGNFWWARSGYIKQLPELNDPEKLKDRYYAEEWIYLKIQRPYSAFDTVVDPYYVEIPRCIYQDKKPTLWQIAVYWWKYSFYKFKKYVLKRDYTLYVQRKFQQKAETEVGAYQQNTQND